MDSIINTRVILLSMTNGDSEQKRYMCHAMCGTGLSTINDRSPWLKGDVEKPQYIHSATSIYLLLKYPHMRPPNSYISLIIEGGQICEQAWLKIATDILDADSDAKKFMANSDEMFKEKKVTVTSDTSVTAENYVGDSDMVIIYSNKHSK